MLGLPTTGIAYSVNEHKVDLDAICDWIEGSVLLEGESVSDTDIVDALRENEVYATQAMAWEMVSNAWRELQRRVGWLGAGCPIQLQGKTISPRASWRDAPAHAFCLTLAYAKWFPKWATSFGKDYTTQGELFEQLTLESLQVHFPEWETHLTGWSKSHPKKLAEVVASVASLLGEPVGEVERWTKASANEAGLDLLCFRSFDDSRAGVPVLLVQCASGKHYEGKLHTPSLRVWGRIVNFTTKPTKAFVTPFALADSEFTRVANFVNGMLIDRYRLLSHVRTNVAWVSPALSARLVQWVEARIASLPKLD